VDQDVQDRKLTTEKSVFDLMAERVAAFDGQPSVDFHMDVHQIHEATAANPHLVDTLDPGHLVGHGPYAFKNLLRRRSVEDLS